ncbi:MAG: phosphoribosylamine--glycine ligase [Pyrobaculum sp.]
MDKVLVVGDGAREHAIAWALAKSGVRVYAAMGYPNPGMAEVVKRTGGGFKIVSTTSPREVAEAAEAFSPDLVVIGPEEPLFAGVADALGERGFLTFGASAAAAVVEMRKDVARGLQWKYGIKGRLIYGVFKEASEAYAFAKALGAVAIKPIRQAGGKGVRVVYGEAKYLDGAFDDVILKGAHEAREQLKSYKDVDAAVLVEEGVWGVEYTVQTLTDGDVLFPFPPVQDNPHAFELGLGPECGGMGTLSPLPFIEEAEVEEAVEALKATVDAVAKEFGVRYRGALSGQMMLTARGPVLIEYYARLGDPEAVNAMYLYEGDAYQLFKAAAEGKLHKAERRFRQEYTVVKAVAPVGYPHKRELAKGRRFWVDWDVAKREGCLIFFGSAVESPGGGYETLGSRAVEVLAAGATLEEAYEKAERCADAVRGEGLYHRADIASPQYLEAMTSKAEAVRAVYRWRRARGLDKVKIVWEPGRGVERFVL